MPNHTYLSVGVANRVSCFKQSESLVLIQSLSVGFTAQKISKAIAAAVFYNGIANHCNGAHQQKTRKACIDKALIAKDTGSGIALIPARLVFSQAFIMATAKVLSLIAMRVQKTTLRPICTQTIAQGLGMLGAQANSVYFMSQGSTKT